MVFYAANILDMNIVFGRIILWSGVLFAICQMYTKNTKIFRGKNQ